MHKISISIATLLLAISSPAAFAQALTFDQALQAALASHPAVMGKRSSAQAAQAEQEGAKWQRYPTPSIEAAQASSGGTSTLLRIQQPLWTGGRITAGIEAAGRRFDAALAAVDESRQEIGLKVIAAFTEAERQQARQLAAVRGVREHEKLLKLIERRVASGVSPAVDRDFAQSRLFQAANELSVATQARANALTQLTQLTGQTVSEVVGEMNSSEVRDIHALGSLETALERAVGHSPVLRRLAYEEAAAQEEIALKRAAYLPQVALRLERTTGGVAGMSDSRALLVLEAQPGAGLSAVANVDAAVARREAVRLQREAALRDLHERVSLDWNEWVAARLRLENARASRTMSAEVFDSYTRQYVTGRKTWIDVLNAVREITQAELVVADTAAQAAAAGLRLRLLTGDWQ